MKIIASQIILTRLHTALNMENNDARRLIWGSIYAAAKKTANKYNRTYQMRELDESDVLQVWYSQLDDRSMTTISTNEGDMLCGFKSLSQDLQAQANQLYAEQCAEYMKDLERWENRVATEPYSLVLMNRKPRRPRFIQPRMSRYEDVETFGANEAWDEQHTVNDLATIRFDRDEFYQAPYVETGERTEEIEAPLAPKNGTPEEWTLFINQLREKNGIEHNDRNNITSSRGPRGANRLRHLYVHSDNEIERTTGQYMRVRGKRGERKVTLPNGRTTQVFIVKV